eukprot:m.8902 g.8902  ORF g.8902 m.8902 type:complete len:1203 (-) comp3970_c0_seq1:38-3646(-)
MSARGGAEDSPRREADHDAPYMYITSTWVSPNHQKQGAIGPDNGFASGPKTCISLRNEKTSSVKVKQHSLKRSKVVEIDFPDKNFHFDVKAWMSDNWILVVTLIATKSQVPLGSIEITLAELKKKPPNEWVPLSTIQNKSPDSSPKNKGWRNVHEILLSGVGSTGWKDTVSADTYNELSEEERKRQHAVFELIKTEEDYLRDLQLVLTHFGQNDLNIFDPSTFETIFNHHWKTLQTASTLFVGDLKTLQEQGNGVIAKIGNVLDQHLPNLGKALLAFVPLSRSILTRIADMRTNEKISTGLQHKQALCGNLSLESFIIKPFQRLTRYPLLLEEILQVTPETHEDHDSVAWALQISVKYGKEANEKTRTMEMHAELHRIRENLVIPAELAGFVLAGTGTYLLHSNSFSPYRMSSKKHLLKKGTPKVELVVRGKKWTASEGNDLRVLLMTDVLTGPFAVLLYEVSSATIQSGKHVDGITTMYILGSQRIPLDSVTIKEVDEILGADTQTDFQFVYTAVWEKESASRDVSLFLRASSPSKKTSWISSFEALTSNETEFPISKDDMVFIDDLLALNQNIEKSSLQRKQNSSEEKLYRATEVVAKLVRLARRASLDSNTTFDDETSIRSSRVSGSAHNSNADDMFEESRLLQELLRLQQVVSVLEDSEDLTATMLADEINHQTSLAQDLELYETTIDEMNKSLQEHKKIVAEVLSRENKALDEKAQINASFKGLKRENATMMVQQTALNRSIKEAESKIEELEEKLKNYQRNDNENENENEKTKTLRKELQEKDARIQDLSTNLEALGIQVADLEDKLDATEEEKQSLGAQGAELEDKLDASEEERQALGSEVAGLEDQLDKLEHEKQLLAEKLEQVEKDFEQDRQRLQENIEQAEKQYEQDKRGLQDKVAHVEKELAGAIEAQQSLGAQVAEMEDEVDASEASKAQVQEQLDKVLEEQKALEAQLETTSAKGDNSQDLKKLLEDLKSANATIDTLTQELTTTREELLKETEAKQAAEDENIALTEKLSDAEISEAANSLGEAELREELASSLDQLNSERNNSLLIKKQLEVMRKRNLELEENLQQTSEPNDLHKIFAIIAEELSKSPKTANEENVYEYNSEEVNTTGLKKLLQKHVAQVQLFQSELESTQEEMLKAIDDTVNAQYDLSQEKELSLVHKAKITELEQELEEAWKLYEELLVSQESDS